MMLRASPSAEAPGRIEDRARPWSRRDRRAPIGGGRPTSSVNRSPKPRHLDARRAPRAAMPRARPDQDASSWVPSAVCRSSSIRSDRRHQVAHRGREDAHQQGAVGEPVEVGVVDLAPQPQRLAGRALDVEPRAVDVLLRAVERRLVRARAGDVGHAGRPRWEGRRRDSCGCGRTRGSPPPACASSGRQASAGLNAQSCESRPSRYASESRNTPFKRDGQRAVRRREVAVAGDLEGVEAAVGDAGRRRPARHRLLAHEVHGAGERVRAVEERRRPLHHLDLAHVVQRVEGALGLEGAVGEDQRRCSANRSRGW